MHGDSSSKSAQQEEDAGPIQTLQTHRNLQEEGSAVMLVCVNPFDTGFDENSHVMRFAAVARSIQTTATATTSKFVPVPESSDIDEGKSLIGAPWSCFGTDVLFRLVS
jgi:hypothetical protein